jgi:hypothetical protein
MFYYLIKLIKYLKLGLSPLGGAPNSRERGRRPMWVPPHETLDGGGGQGGGTPGGGATSPPPTPI